MKQKKLSEKEAKELFNKIINDIQCNCNLYKELGGDMKDIGDLIGKAIGSNTCKKFKEQTILDFTKEDFKIGFRHGYSLHDGSH